MAVELTRFLTGSGLLEDAVILAPKNDSQFVIEAIGGKEVFRVGTEQGLPTDKLGFSGLARILAEAQRAGVIDIGDTVPRTLIPELGMAFAGAINRFELVPYFNNLEIARRIARQEPRDINPLLWEG